MWTCPVCGRKFAKENQWHSHQVYNLDHHFKKRPEELRELFDYLKSKIEKFGNLKMSIVKTGITFVNKTTFLALAVKKDHLMIEFFSDKKIEDPIVFKTFDYTKNKIVHYVPLQEKSDLNKIVLGWLKKSYEMAG